MAELNDSKYVDDVTYRDDEKVEASRHFTKTWRVRNNGSRRWGSGYRFAHVGGTAMTDTQSHPVPAVDPGKEVNISIPLVAPETPGTYRGDWQLKDDQGNFFGQKIWVQIEVVPSTRPAAEGQNNSRFIADITIADGMTLKANSEFVKTWRVLNTGEQAWGPGFSLVHVKDEPMTKQIRQPLPVVQPGEQADISIKLTAPAQQRQHYSYWQMEDRNGRRFGQVLWVDINVM